MTREAGGSPAAEEVVVPFTLVGGAGMTCEGDSCAVPSAGGLAGDPEAGDDVAEPAGVSAE